MRNGGVAETHLLFASGCSLVGNCWGPVPWYRCTPSHAHGAASELELQKEGAAPTAARRSRSAARASSGVVVTAAAWLVNLRISLDLCLSGDRGAELPPVRLRRYGGGCVQRWRRALEQVDPSMHLVHLRQLIDRDASIFHLVRERMACMRHDHRPVCGLMAARPNIEDARATYQDKVVFLEPQR
jgi:hypothetical protein